jgi:AbrB family looped-hinge helix DNA binding protein
MPSRGKDIMSKVTAKYQITIPPKIRKMMGVVPGAEVDVIPDGDRFVLVLDPVSALKKKWRGICKNGKTTDQVMGEDRGPVE